MFKNQENPIRPVGPISDEAAGSASSLMVKLKLPKFMVDQEKEEGDLLINKGHVCKICERSFSSGKALGGHMSSAHVQAQASKDMGSLKKLKSKMMKRNGTLLLGSRCKICGKDFPTKKSLFGHMRSHPERGWRGMEPPEDEVEEDDEEEEEEKIELSEASSRIGYHGLLLSYSGEDKPNEERNDLIDLGPVVDLSESLTGWVVTGKRGRPSYEPGPELDEETELHVAVQQLIRLVNDPGTTKKVERVGERVRSYPPGPDCEKAENRAFGPQHKLICEDGAFNDEDATVKSMSISSEDESDGDEPDFKKANLSDLVKCSTGSDKSFINPNPSSAKGKFICNICNKSFWTHQALGGHRSSHTKFKVTIHNTIDEAQSNKLLGSSFRAHSDGNLHICEVCSKCFPTSKSLRGHKKYHVTNSNVVDSVPPSSSPSTYAGGTSSIGKVDPSSSSQGTPGDGRASTERKVLDFDLNEPGESEEGVDQSKDGAAGC